MLTYLLILECFRSVDMQQGGLPVWSHDMTLEAVTSCISSQIYSTSVAHACTPQAFICWSYHTCLGLLYLSRSTFKPVVRDCSASQHTLGACDDNLSVPRTSLCIMVMVFRAAW